MSWCFSVISEGISTRSFFTGLGFLPVDLPFRLDMSGLKMRLAIFTFSTITGQFCMAFMHSNALKFSTVGIPTMWYSFRAVFALSYCQLV